MPPSAETIGALAAALAKAQAELTNPEKSLTVTLPSPSPQGVQSELPVYPAREWARHRAQMPWPA